MRLMKAALALLVTLCIGGLAHAQSTTGTIRGHVSDAQGLALPGVTVSVSSPNLQGTRTAVSADNGDYVLTLLPSGTYTVRFDIGGFETVSRTVSLAPTQDLPLDVSLGPAAVSEELTIVGRRADVLTQTAQVATNFKQDLIESLPTNRDINAYLLLAPAVHPTGPNGGYSIAGSASYESLFLVNGVTVNENLRGQANDLYIEDAIQETTVATAGISAEYGRFSGGVVNVVTKSGGNTFSGSFRESLFNDGWRTLTPFEERAIARDPAHRELRVDKVVPTHEYTFGGPIMKDRLWFFTAGRIQTQSEGRTLVGTNLPYTYKRPTQRYEGKGTFSLTSSHRFQGTFSKILDEQQNNTFNTSVSSDLASLNTRKTPQDLAVVNYNGVLGSRFFVEALFSQRHFTFEGDGANSTDLVNGTLMIDNSQGYRFWSATFCGVCDPTKRDNIDLYGKATYFLAPERGGSHTLTFGMDAFNDKIFANNHQSGSDYRIYNTGTIIRGTGESAVIYPVSLGDGSTFIQWNPIPLNSKGSNFRTYSTFVNDSWRVSSRVTANLGVRWDKNRGRDQQGSLVANDSAFSPRLGVVVDPRGDQKWSVTASFAQYVAALNNAIGDSASGAGNPQTFRFAYRGPDINADQNGALTPTPQAIRQIFDWYFANGADRLPYLSQPTIPGVTPQIRGNLKSPNVLEYAAGVNRQFGARAALRADFVYRRYRDFYAQRTDTGTGRVTNALGQSFDLTLVENTNALKRRYKGITAQGTYRFGARTDVGGTYTLSRTWGNDNGENVVSGPVPSGLLSYPEYAQPSWGYPEGDLQVDQRHRARLWVNIGVPRMRNLTLSLLQTLESGVPFGPNNINAANFNGIDPRPYVVNPGYLTPPDGASTAYFYTVDCSTVPAAVTAAGFGCTSGRSRDAFRTVGQKRTDLGINYTFRMPATKSLEFFAHADVINLFDQSQLCGCGGTVFGNSNAHGGGVSQTRIDQTVRTAVSHPALYAPFNPFTTTPVQGVNWNYGPNFGTALNRFAYTTPRTFRVNVGVRF
ncbi:MAG: TonB-dependent receptor [Acidobacteria bacterium]|nr:TonB-dependent receptor [Acidobacteriota bacterium]